MFNLTIAHLRLNVESNQLTPVCVCLSLPLFFLSVKKGKTIQLNTKEVPCEVKLQNEATIQGNSSYSILTPVVWN